MGEKENKIISVDDLQKGDIILYHDDKSFVSRMINKISGGFYSHAAIFIGKNSNNEALIMESTLKKGVSG